MSVNNFILNCEKENKELAKDIEYYKNKNKRLQQRIDKAIEYIKLNVKNDWSIVDASIVWNVLPILQGKE